MWSGSGELHSIFADLLNIPLRFGGTRSGDGSAMRAKVTLLSDEKTAMKSKSVTAFGSGTVRLTRSPLAPSRFPDLR